MHAAIIFAVDSQAHAIQVLQIWACPKCYFLHPFLDLVSVSNIHDRGHKRDVHVNIGGSHVII